MASFDAAIGLVLAREGGYKPAGDGDPGGETNFGVTKRDHPDVDIRALTRDTAAAIYRRDWDYLRLGEVKDQDVAAKVFDMTVNLGRQTAIRRAQRALNYLTPRHAEVTVDGYLGDETIAALNAADAERLLLALRAYHAARYVELVEGPDTRYETWAAGWLKRAMS